VTDGSVEARVLVSGRVQGVFFRGTTKDEALRAGVRGWVMNLPDGRVEAVVQGAREAVERVVDFMRTGPPGARVDRIDVSWGPPREVHDGFSLRYPA
jgi:acylphosphatase